MEKYGYYFNKLSKIAQLKALEKIEEHSDWLVNLDRMVTQLADHWKLTLGDVLVGGTASLIIEATMESGESAVLKIALPGSNIYTEALVLRATNGNGYVQLYDVDFDRQALLLEKLGAPLSGTLKTLEEHVNTLCAVLKKAWVKPSSSLALPTSVNKALQMKEIIEKKWIKLNKPFSQQTFDLAIAYIQDRIDSYNPESCVLVHGDAHGHNILKASGDEYKFVDPDGIIADKGFDLICIMRDWSDDLLKENTLELLLARCSWLSELTGAEEISIWQWGYLGRLVIGLTLLELGKPIQGIRTLEVAERISHYNFS